MAPRRSDGTRTLARILGELVDHQVLGMGCASTSPSRPTREDGSAVPPLLSEWAQEVALGDRKHPGLRRGRPSDEDRDMRINVVVRVLANHHGRSHEAACKEVGEFVSLSTEAVKSICRRVRHAHPFPGQKIGLLVHLWVGGPHVAYSCPEHAAQLPRIGHD